MHATVDSLRKLTAISVKVRDYTDTVGPYMCTCQGVYLEDAGSNKCEGT